MTTDFKNPRQKKVEFPSTNNNGILKCLPDDLAVSIYSLLQPEDLIKVSELNHYFHHVSQQPLLWRGNYLQHFFTKNTKEIIDKNSFIKEYQRYVDVQTELDGDSEDKNEINVENLSDESKNEINGEKTIEAKPSRWREKILAALRGDIDKITQSNLHKDEKERLYMLAAKKGYRSAYPYLKGKTDSSINAFEWAVEDKNLSAMVSLLEYFGPEIGSEKMDDTIDLNFLTAVETKDAEFVNDYYQQFGKKVTSSQLEVALDKAITISVEMVETIWKLADNGNVITTQVKDMAFVRAAKKGELGVLEKLYELCKGNTSRPSKVDAFKFAAKKGNYANLIKVIEWFNSDILPQEKAEALLSAIKNDEVDTVEVLLNYCKDDILAATHTSFSETSNAIDHAAEISLEENNELILSMLMPYFKWFSSATKKEVLVRGLESDHVSLARGLLRFALEYLSEKEWCHLKSITNAGKRKHITRLTKNEKNDALMANEESDDECTFTSDDEREFKQKPW